MAVLVAPIDAAGAVTAPSSLTLALPSSDSLTWHPGLPVSTAKMPGEDLVIAANGYDPLRHVFGSTYYRTGGLAPSAAPTVAPSGAQATATFDLSSGNIGASDVIVIGVPGGGSAYIIQFVSSLASARPQNLGWAQCLVGGSDSATLDNLREMIEADSGDSGDGVRYWHHTSMLTGGAYWNEWLEVTGKTSTTLALQVKDFGSAGNDYHAYLSSGFGGGEDLGSQGTTVGTTGYFENGSDGSGSAPEAGTYRYLQTNVRTADGAETGPSPVATAQQGTAQEVDVDGLSKNDDDTFDFVRIYRTEDTGEEFFRCGDVARALSASPDFTDDVPNGEDDYSLQGFGAAAYDSSAFLNYRGGYPPRGRVVAVWKARVWTGGAVLAADYSAGTANVTADSASVTLSSTAAPTEEMVGDTFQVDGDAETYQIMAVTESTRVLTLDRQYQGTTDTTADYTIKDLRDPTQIYCSEANLPNQWPARNNPGSVDTDGDDEGITGMVALDDALIIFTRTTMTRLTGDDIQSWSLRRVSGGEGCVAHRTIQKVSLGGSTGVMWLSPNGVMLYGGSGAPVNLSSPSAEVGLDDTLDRINWPHAHLAHSRYSESQRVVELFVPLDNDATPRNTLVLDLGARTFTGPDRVPDLTTSGVVVGADGQRYGIAGSRFGAIWQLDLGTSDGGYGSYEPVQTLTSGATVRAVTRSTGTDWPTTGDGLDWLPATVVYADGTYADTLIASNTDNDLTFAYDLATAPASGDQVVVGCIHMIVESGRVMLSDGYSEITVRRLVVLHSPEDDGAYYVSVATDQGALAVPPSGDDYQTGDFTETSGRRLFNWRGRGMLHKFALHVLEPGVSGAFIGYGYDAETRS